MYCPRLLDKIFMLEKKKSLLFFSLTQIFRNFAIKLHTILTWRWWIIFVTRWFSNFYYPPPFRGSNFSAHIPYSGSPMRGLRPAATVKSHSHLTCGGAYCCVSHSEDIKLLDPYSSWECRGSFFINIKVNFVLSALRFVRIGGFKKQRIERIFWKQIPKNEQKFSPEIKRN